MILVRDFIIKYVDEANVGQFMANLRHWDSTVTRSTFYDIDVLHDMNTDFDD